MDIFEDERQRYTGLSKRASLAVLDLSQKLCQWVRYFVLQKLPDYIILCAYGGQILDRTSRPNPEMFFCVLPGYRMSTSGLEESQRDLPERCSKSSACAGDWERSGK